MQGYLDSSGWIAMTNAQALDALGRVLDLDMPVVTVARADWSRLAATHRPIARAARLAGLMAGAGAVGSSERLALAALDGETLTSAALDLVIVQAARVLRVAPETLSSHQTLAEAGIDLLSSFELHNRIEHAAGVGVAMSRFARARRISELADLVASIVQETSGTRQGTQPS